MTDQGRLIWRTSSFGVGSNAWTEGAELAADGRVVRDSTDCSGHVLQVTEKQ